LSESQGRHLGDFQNAKADYLFFKKNGRLRKARSVWTASALAALSGGRNLAIHQPPRRVQKAAVNRPQSRRFASTDYFRQ